jgi:phytoene dehydrogenase-like protein
MVKATFAVLSERDKQLVLETDPKRLRELDEDALLALHTRVRRARTKHQTNYRRAAAGGVKRDRARALASPKARRDAARAEVLEDALARVSRSLAFAARASADELRATRLAAARKDAAATKAKGSSKGDAKGKASKRKATDAAKGKGKTTRTPASEKRRAGAKASKKRAQAKRDGR